MNSIFQILSVAGALEEFVVEVLPKRRSWRCVIRVWRPAVAGIKLLVVLLALITTLDPPRRNPKGRGVTWAKLLLVVTIFWPVPSEAWTSPLWVVQERAYRVGVFLVVDALVENASARRVDWAEVAVEFYNFFDELVSVEYTLLRPATLGPGHKAVVRVITPYSNAVRKIGYRFTWWQDRVQVQDVAKRDLWLK